MRRPTRPATRQSAAPGAIRAPALATTLPLVPAGSDEQTPAVSPAAGEVPGRPFAPGSFWNAAIPADAPLEPGSATYVQQLRQQIAEHVPWINTTRFSSPVYTVRADQPTVRVTIDQPQPLLQAASLAVPVPEAAVPAAGSDGTLIVWQPASDTMWEYWQASHRADGWHAMYGGRMTRVSTNPGYFAAPAWGATATSLPFLGGLIRIADLQAGKIDHALAMAIPGTRAGVWSWPAQRGDGVTASTSAIPEGARFRLDPSLDIPALHLPYVTGLIAQAAQRYGIVVRDTAANVAFYAEDPTPTGTDPYSGAGGFFGGQYPSKLLAAFPWASLQLLKMDITSAGGA